MIPATYNGDGSFQDMFLPVPGKSEWGMDTLTRVIGGSQPNLAAFISSLSQGQVYNFSGTLFYLQSWNDDHDAVFPKVTLNYKGLVAGIPAPKTSGKQISQAITVTCAASGDLPAASRSINYFTRESTYLYIKSGRPTGPTYSALDVTIAPEIWWSIIRTADGTTYPGNAPSGLVSALTPTTYNQALMECSPVIGSPYFECVDTVTQLYFPMDH